MFDDALSIIIGNMYVLSDRPQSWWETLVQIMVRIMMHVFFSWRVWRLGGNVDDTVCSGSGKQFLMDLNLFGLVSCPEMEGWARHVLRL